MLREDLRGIREGGNKYFKLKYNLKHARENGYRSVLSFGGVHSNHIAALAEAGKRAGISTIGIIRGEEQVFTPTLIAAQENGMFLEFISRSDYRLKDEPGFLNALQLKYPGSFIIPEGGSNMLGVEGCKEIVNDITVDFDIICLPVATGATAAGVLKALDRSQQLIGFQVMKAEGLGMKNILKYASPANAEQLRVYEDFHFNGYAKVNDQLIGFKKDFEKEFNIPLDFVYTSKMMFGLFELLKSGQLIDKRIVVIHTGGLQGNQGFEKLLN